MQKLAVHATGGILVNGMESLYEENDLILAEQAIASDLKLLDALIKSDPGNEKLLVLAAEGYTSYALGFVEDDSPLRASNFYLRAKNYGLRVLNINKHFQQAQNVAELQQALISFQKDDVPALFWTANAWGSYINLNKTDVQALSDIPRVQAMMERVLTLDESYYYGGPHLFLGVILASKPPMLGGDPQKAKEHFETCLRINDNKFLLAKYFYAQTYAVQVQNRELFRSLLQDILEAPDDLLPQQRLANEIAKRKAARLIKMEDDLFF